MSGTPDARWDSWRRCMSICARDRSAAVNVTTGIRSTIARLREMPLLGKVTDEDGVHVIIEPEYLYRVFYRVEGEQVVVIRILHGRQERRGADDGLEFALDDVVS